MSTYGWLMLMYGGNHHNIVITFQLKIRGGKKAQIHPPDFTNVLPTDVGIFAI